MAKILILLGVLAAITVVALTTKRAIGASMAQLEEDALPNSVQKISYVLLIILMFGVVTGWLGGL